MTDGLHKALIKLSLEKWAFQAIGPVKKDLFLIAPADDDLTID